MVPYGMLSPVGSLRLSWDGLAATVLLIDVWATLFEIVYMPDATVFGLQLLQYCIIGFFVLDVMLNFCTGYIKKDKIVMDRRACVQKYLAGWFWVDCIATFPFDLVLTGVSDASGAMSLVRIAKVARVLRTLRFLRMIRAHRSLQQARSRKQEVQDVLNALITLNSLLALGLLLAHIDACIHGALQFWVGTLNRTDDFHDALVQYWENFLWAFLGLAAGDGDQEGAEAQESLTLRAFEMVVAGQRLILMAMLGLWAVTTGSRYFERNDGFRMQKADTLQYLQKRKVSLEMQLQIVYFMNQAHKAQVMQSRFQHFTSHNWPEELRRAVCEELWATKLLSLGLILHVAPWHHDLLTRLSMIVCEDVFAEQMQLCREGSPSIAAYYIIKGRFSAESYSIATSLPPFIDGMWVGERALVKPFMLHKMTCVALSMSCTMTVPSERFHQILHQLDLQHSYQGLCKEHVSKGLCGRCGAIGEHMIHGCPTIRDAGQQPAVKRRCWPKLPKPWSLLKSSSFDPERLRGQFQQRMATSEIIGISELESAEIARAADIAAPEATEHLVFLSHYKVEAGTEASLIRKEIEQMISEDTSSLGHYFDSPVFLDSEDLHDLENLQERVKYSHNLLFLLSKNVLSRPWVVLELCTALEANVRIVPVQLVKADKFEIPDDRFYADFAQGTIIDSAGQEVLREHGVTLDHVVACLRKVFKRIAMPYSPHRAAGIRRAELNAILKLCRLRTDDTNPDDAAVNDFQSHQVFSD